MGAGRSYERERERRRLPRGVPLALGGLCLLGGFLLGGAGSRSGGTPAAAGGAGPARWRDGVPQGFAHSRAGAAQAVASYERAFASPRILRPGVLRRRIEAVASRGYVRTMLAANGPGERRIAAGPIGAGLGHGVATVFCAVPIGYRIESYSPPRAEVLTWGFTLLGNASGVEPAAYFGLTHTTLVWRKGDWKIAATRGGFGPTPKLQTPRAPLEGFDVLSLAKGLRSYGTTP
jgi:hypothetical protein